VILKLERALTGETLPEEELNNLKDYFETFSGLFHEEMEASTHPQHKSYSGPRRCPVCRTDYKGGPDNCPQGCNPRNQGWVPLEYRNL